jgi:vacuolar-type H+-ATPase subunit C/Vma6
MDISYVYSATRTNALGNELLSETDINRLLVTTPGVELQTALKETYLAPYVLQTKDEDVAEAIEVTLVEAKQLISQIAPRAELLAVLWVQYDIHNLRVFSKASAKDMNFEALGAYTSLRGIYEPAELYEHTEAGTLDRLQIDWQKAYNVAVKHVEAGELDQVDAVFDELLFASIKRSVTASNDKFLKQYVASVIDTYNAKATLRQLRLKGVTFRPGFISGGTFAEGEIDSKEGVVAALDNLSPGFFTHSVEVYTETGNTSELDARIDDYHISLAKNASVDMFSSASLVLYYLRVRQAAANIRTIVVGKNSGMNETTIRTNLRLAYVNS